MRWLGLLFCLACGGVVLIGVAVGAAYHPDLGSRYLTVTVVFLAILCFCGFLLFQKQLPPLGSWLDGVAAMIGGGLFCWGGYLIANDPGDALLWAPIPALGLCLLGVVITKKLGGDFNALS